MDIIINFSDITIYLYKNDNMKKLTNDEFIEKAKQIHGDKYDYSKTNYIKAFSKVCIICPEHGEFWQLPIVHLRGCGCKKCSHMADTNSFVEKAKQIHGDKYDYSKVVYKGNNEKVCIICPIHGEFWQTPHHHLSGSGCQKCGNLLKKESHKKVSKEKVIEAKKKSFIKAAKKKYGDLYDYSDIEYVDNLTKICLNSSKYGKIEITPQEHLKLKYGCRLEKRKTRKYSKEKFIEMSRQIHGDKYDYSKVEYDGMLKKICIICPKHGEFWQTPNAHIHLMEGCPICNESHLEKDISDLLSSKGVNFERQCTNSRFKWIGLQRLDFYLPDKNIVIECQGEQHYNEKSFYPYKDLNRQIELDLLKKTNCEKNGLKVVYYVDNKKNILNKKISNIYNDCNTFDKLEKIWELLE